MNSIPAMNMFITPLSMWSRLAWKAGEMAISSAQVIGQRASRFALAGATPNALDQREFVLMSQEKGEAALESAQAVGSRMFLMGQQFATLAFKQALSTSVSLMSIAKFFVKVLEVSCRCPCCLFKITTLVKPIVCL